MFRSETADVAQLHDAAPRLRVAAAAAIDVKLLELVERDVDLEQRREAREELEQRAINFGERRLEDAPELAVARLRSRETECLCIKLQGPLAAAGVRRAARESPARGTCGRGTSCRTPGTHRACESRVEELDIPRRFGDELIRLQRHRVERERLISEKAQRVE